MLRCDRCYYINGETQSRACPRCGSLFANTSALILTQRFPVAQGTGGLRLNREHIGKLQRQDIALYISNTDGPLITTLFDQVILGRVGRSRQEAQIEAFDLSPFQAVERGVSRAHAVLKRYNLGIAVMDLGSTNGTWVNNNRVQPQTLSLLASGDKITFAKLSLYIYFE